MKANRNAAAVSQTQVVRYSQAGYQHAWQADSEQPKPARTGEKILAGIVVVLVVIIVAVVLL